MFDVRRIKCGDSTLGAQAKPCLCNEVNQIGSFLVGVTVGGGGVPEQMMQIAVHANQGALSLVVGVGIGDVLEILKLLEVFEGGICVMFILSFQYK